MNKFDSVEAKLFYTVYTMGKEKIISPLQKGRLKDMIIRQDQIMLTLFQKCKEDAKTLSQLLYDLVKGLDQHESVSPTHQMFGTRYLTIQRPCQVQLAKSNFLIKSSGFLTSSDLGRVTAKEEDPEDCSITRKHNIINPYHSIGHM